MTGGSNVVAFGKAVAPVKSATSAVNDKLLAAEAAIAAAIAAVEELTSMIPMASERAGVEALVTSDALALAQESGQQLVRSQNNIRRSHRALRSAHDETGLNTLHVDDIAGLAEADASPDGSFGDNGAA